MAVENEVFCVTILFFSLIKSFYCLNDYNLGSCTVERLGAWG